MGFVNLLKGIYYSAEDKWYDLLDALDRRHLPVYKIIDPIDSVVPSFLLFILTMIFILVLIAYILQFYSPVEFTFTAVDSSTKETLSEVVISGYINNEQFSKVTGSSGEAKVIMKGKPFNLFEKMGSLFFSEEFEYSATISAEKSGYQKVVNQKKDLSSRDATISLTAMTDGQDTDDQFVSGVDVELVDNATGERIIDSKGTAFVKYNCSNKGIAIKTSSDGYDGAIDGKFRLTEPTCGFTVKGAYSDGYESLNGINVELPTTTNLHTIQLTKLTSPTKGIAKIFVYEKNSSPLIPLPNIQIRLLDLMGNSSQEGTTDYSGVFSKEVDPGTYIITATSPDGNYFAINSDANQLIVVTVNKSTEKTIYLQRLDPALVRFLRIKVVDYNGRVPLRDVTVFPQKLILSSDGNRTAQGIIGVCTNACKTDINGLITISGLSAEDEGKIVVSLFKENYLSKVFEPTIYKINSLQFETIELEKADYSINGNAGKGLVLVRTQNNLRGLVAKVYMYFNSPELNINGINLFPGGMNTNQNGEALFMGLKGRKDKVYYASAKYNEITGVSAIKAVDVNKLVIFDINLDTQVSFLEVRLLGYNGIDIVDKDKAIVKIISLSQLNPTIETLTFNSSSQTFKSTLHEQRSTYSLLIDLNNYVPLRDDSIILSKVGSNLVNKQIFPTSERILVVFNGLYEELNENEALDVPATFFDLNNPLSESTKGYYAKTSYVLGKSLMDGNILGMLRVSNKMNVTNLSKVTLDYFKKSAIYSCTPPQKFPYNDDNYYIQSVACESNSGQQASAMWDENVAAGVYDITTKLVFTPTAANGDKIDLNYSGKKNDFNSVFEDRNKTSFVIGAPTCRPSSANPSCSGIFFYSELNGVSLGTEKYNYDSTKKEFSRYSTIPYEIEVDTFNLLKIKVLNNFSSKIDFNLKVYAYSSPKDSFNSTPSGFLRFDSLTGDMQKTIGMNLSVDPLEKSYAVDVNVFSTQVKIFSYIVVVAELKNGEKYFLFLDTISPGRKLFLLNSPFLSGVPDQVFDAEVLGYTNRLAVDVHYVTWSALRNCDDNNVIAYGTADVNGNYFKMTIPDVYEYRQDCLKLTVVPKDTFYNNFSGEYLAGTGGIIDPTLSCITPSLVDGSSASEARLQWGQTVTLSIRNSCADAVELQLNTRLIMDGNCTNLQPEEICRINITAMNKDYSDQIANSDILGVFPIFIKAKLINSLKKFSPIKTIRVHVTNPVECFGIDKDTFDLFKNPNNTAFVLTNECQSILINDYFIPKAKLDLTGITLGEAKPTYGNITVNYDIIVTGGGYELKKLITPRTRVRLDYVNYPSNQIHAKILQPDGLVKYTKFHFEMPSDLNVVSEDIMFKWVDNSTNPNYGAKIDGDYIITYKDGRKQAFTPAHRFELTPQARCVHSGGGAGECIIAVDTADLFEDVGDVNMLYGLTENKFTKGQIKAVDFNIIGNPISQYLQIQVKFLVDYNEISYVAERTGGDMNSTLTSGSFTISPIQGASFLVRNFSNNIIDPSVTQKTEFCKKFLTNTGWISGDNIYWTNKHFLPQYLAVSYCAKSFFPSSSSILVSDVSTIPTSLLNDWNNNISSFSWINSGVGGFWTQNCINDSCNSLIRKQSGYFAIDSNEFVDSALIDNFSALCVQPKPQDFFVDAASCAALGVTCDAQAGTCIDSKPIVFDAFQSAGFIMVDNPQVEVKATRATTNNITLNNSAIGLWVEGGILKATFLGSDYIGYNDKTIEMNIIDNNSSGDMYGLLRIVDYITPGRTKN